MKPGIVLKRKSPAWQSVAWPLTGSRQANPGILFLIFIFQFLILNSEFVIVKAQPLVQQEWVARYVNNFAAAGTTLTMALDSLNSIIITGPVFTLNLSRVDFCTVKYNSAGVQQWVPSTMEFQVVMEIIYQLR